MSGTESPDLDRLAEAREIAHEAAAVRRDMRWFERHRIEWIAETLRVFGFINREHIERKFGISTPQASLDLSEFQRLYPAAITYNKASKRYERTETVSSESQ